MNSGQSVFEQDVDKSLDPTATTLKPWYLNYLGGIWDKATQCMVAGDNGYQDNHAALNSELNNKWALNNTPWSWGHFRRKDIPIHFAIAEAWTVGDMYQESVISSTDPNRVSWISGSINCPGGPQTPDEGGIALDNNESPGCEGKDLNCYPYKWQTFPEYLEAGNVSWQVYQDVDNFDDNPLAWFEQFQNASKTSDLYQRGLTYKGLDAFYSDAAAGTLPMISYIVGPMELSEHPPYQPIDGAWLQSKVVNALVGSQSYKDSALLISWDETGGWGDHVVPYHSPAGTPGEWLEDPYGLFGQVYTGPGFRLPFYIVSPWTRGSNVYTENADHISQIKFQEAWLAAKGYNVKTTQIPPWRAQNMADLTKAFDFSSPDYSNPNIPLPATPSTNDEGVYDGYAVCEATYPTQRPPVPYHNQTAANTITTETGFKSVRGQLTEGRCLTFEMNGYALANSNNALKASKATAKHALKPQRFVIHQLAAGGNHFTISSDSNGKYITSTTAFGAAAKAVAFAINDLGNGAGHTLQDTATGMYASIGKNGAVTFSKTAKGFSVFSVTYTN